jgi:hypothetical protein
MASTEGIYYPSPAVDHPTSKWTRFTIAAVFIVTVGMAIVFVLATR